MELAVPDFAGAMDGSSPSHLWPDACAYGVGAGLFHGYSAVAPGSTPDTHYTVLGVPTWATKADVEERFRSLRRDRKVHSGSNEQAVDEAFSVLSDVDHRRLYDDSHGLASKRRSRIDLRPLGFFSKPLSNAQQSWPTWERELLAVLLSLTHFRSIVAGREVVIHTDHLNNTVLGENLTSPDKILRMLLKVEGMVRPSWVFAPGATQFGDGLSRNPPDRGQVRDQAETKSHMPKTLAEAFAICTGSSVSGDLENDTEEYTQQHQRTVAVPRPALMGWLQRGAQGYVLQRSAHSVPKEMAATFLPSKAGHAEPLDHYDDYRIVGESLYLRAAVMLQPPLIVPTLGRRWLEFVLPSRNKQVQRRMRNALLDGVLHFLRACVTLATTAAFAHGEGALVLMAALPAEVRTAAYNERHVPTDEQCSLEDAALSITSAILIAPFCNLPNAYMPLLREYVP